MIPQIYLRKGKEESLLRRHPWIFSGAIDHIKAEEESDFAEGALVEVYTRQGEFMALGHYQVGSIAVRVLTFEREAIDQAWWNLRIAVAYDVRRTLDLTDNPATTCYRLVHGEGDSLPGLVIDIYGTTAVVQCHSVGMYRSRMQIAEALREVYGERLAAVYDKSSQTVPYKAGRNAVDGYLMGKVAAPTQEVSENGHRFLVNWEEGQKTGFFLDQKYNRRAVARLAAGHTVLDCFTHTGSFALNAAKGGAKRVTAVDVSQFAVDCAAENARKNGLDGVMDCVCANVFDLLPQLAEQPRKYDFIILDPPAFTKSRRTIHNAMTGYKEINYRAMKLLPRGGYLATASCSHFATEELFIKMLRSAAKDAHRQLRQIEVRQQAPDHPILWGVPETNYLKFFLFQFI